MSEFLVILLVHLSGWALVRALGLRDWGAVPLGFITGVFSVIALTLLFVVVGLAATPTAMLATLVIIGVVALAHQRRHLDASAFLTFAATPIVLAGAVAVLRRANLVSYHIDSFRYLTSAALLANDTFREFATANLLTKRMLVSPAMHALAHAYGEHYVRSLTPLLALAALGTLAYVVVVYHRRAPSPPGLWGAWIAGALAAALLLSINRFVFHAFYVNAHLTVGIALLVTTAIGLLLVAQRVPREQRPAAVVLVGLALVVTVVGRPEGFLLAGVALLPIVLARQVTVVERVSLTVVYGAAMLGWHGHVWLTLGSRATLESTGPAALGAVIVVASPLLALPLVTAARRAVLGLVFASLAIALGTLAARDFDPLQRSLDATFQNVVGGAGGWGFSLVMLTLLVLIAAAARRVPGAEVAWYPLAASPVLFFLLVYLRESAYRVGDGDSLNRMLIQIVPLAVLLVGVAVGAPQGDRREGAPEAADGRRPEA